MSGEAVAGRPSPQIRPLRTSTATERPSTLNEHHDDGPSVLAMVGLVAAVVAVTILVFFAVGYAFGRAFL